MGVQVMIEMPEKLYDQAKAIAHSTQRAVGEVLQEIVIRSFPPVYDGGEEFDAMDQEVAAFEAMHAALWEKYPHQFVAVYGGQVVDYDVDEWDLLRRIDQRYPNEVVMIDQVEPTIQREIVFRSPRFVLNHESNVFFI